MNQLKKIRKKQVLIFRKYFLIGVVEMNDFFDEMTESSMIKSKIVEEYFTTWASIMNRKAKSDKLAYIDLFSGPGRYKDGSVSTPIKVLEKIIKNPDFRRKIITVFNDVNRDYVESLQNEINKLVGINLLTHKPIVMNEEVDDKIALIFEKINLVPTFAFIDPWGYKGISKKLIDALIKDWGSDCIFFFNYNRIKMGLNNPVVMDRINLIFGEERSKILRERVLQLDKDEQELTIINELSETLSNDGKRFVLPFRFVREGGKRTSHYLIFISKHVLGYEKMKEIMWKYSSEKEDGVASFSYIQVPKDFQQLSLLLSYTQPLDKLSEDLIRVFSGKSLSVEEIYNQHHVGKPFVMKNYKDVLQKLEEQNLIVVNRSVGKKRIRAKSFPNDLIVTFPSNRNG